VVNFQSRQQSITANSLGLRRLKSGFWEQWNVKSVMRHVLGLILSVFNTDIDFGFCPPFLKEGPVRGLFKSSTSSPFLFKGGVMEHTSLLDYSATLIWKTNSRDVAVNAYYRAEKEVLDRSWNGWLAWSWAGNNKTSIAIGSSKLRDVSNYSHKILQFTKSAGGAR